MHHSAINSSAVTVALLIFVSGIFSLELGISVAIFEIIAGVIAGNFLNIEPQPWIEFHANFGLLGLMFFAGFETDFPLLKKKFRQSLSIGLGSFLIPLILVSLLAFFCIQLTLRQSVLVGIGLSTTSLALVYTILKERNSINSSGGQAMLSAAMVVDVLSMIAMSAIFEGLKFSTIVVLAMFPLSYVVVPRIGHWLFSRYRVNQIEFRIRFILLFLLSLVLVSEQSSIHVAILAFVGGFFFSEILEEHSEIEDKLKSIVFGLMAPIFFFKAGMSIQLSVVDWTVVLEIISLGLIAYVAKFGGTYIMMARDFKKSFAQYAGWLFNFRLSFGIVVASFGLQSGLFGDDLYVALILIVVLSSMFSSLMLRTIPHEI